MNVIYLIFVHDKPAHLKRLLERLNAPWVDFFIHVDKKSSEDFIFLNQYSNVHVVSHYSIEWGGITMVEALLFCCKELLKVCKGDYIFFLSGYDYPVKSNEYIQSYLMSHKKVNYVAASPILSNKCNWLEHGRRRIECYALRLGTKSIATIEAQCFNMADIRQLLKVLRYSPSSFLKAMQIVLFYPQRKHPKNLKPYGGEFWWVLPNSSLEQLVIYVDTHPDFIEYHRGTSIPDELFFSTLVYNLFPKSSIANSCLRYVNWIKGNSPSVIENATLLNRLIDNGNILFARKVLDTKICDFVDIQIKCR